MSTPRPTLAARPSRRMLSGFAALLGLASSALAGGTFYTTLAPGNWNDPAVWDLGAVPGGAPDDQCLVSHAQLVDAPTPFVNTAILAIPGEEGRVTVTDGGLLQAGQVFLGADSNSAILLQEGGATVLTERLVLGSERPGYLELSGGSLTTPELRVGDPSIPAAGAFGGLIIQGSGGSLSAGSLRIGGNSETIIEPTADGAAGLSVIQATDVLIGSTSKLIVRPPYEAEVGHAWDLIHYTGTLSGNFGSVIAFNGLGVSLDTSTPGVLRAVVDSSPYPLLGNTCGNPIAAGLDAVTNANYALSFITGPDTMCGAPFEFGSELWFELTNTGSDEVCVVADYRELSGFPFFQGRLELWDACGGTVLDCDTYTTSDDPIEATATLAPGQTVLVRTSADLSGGVGMQLDVRTESATWKDLGGGSPGEAGVPLLAGTGGPLVDDAPFGLALTQGPGFDPVLFVLSVSSTPLPALGGTVHAFPWVLEVLLVTAADGSLAFDAQWPAGVPAGTEFFVQYICRDTTVPAGLTLSNALRGKTPD